MGRKFVASTPSLKSLFLPAASPGPPVVGENFKEQRVVNAAGVRRFERCTFVDIRFEMSPGQKGSLAGSEFAECSFRRCYFGPATLDLSRTSFRGSDLRDVEFMLGRLSHSSFAEARLRNVTFRSARLLSASFQGATLQRVSFERATLTGADFMDVRLLNGDFWGEPPWHDALVPDEVRYSFGIVRDLLARLDQALASDLFSADERSRIQAIRDWVGEWDPKGPEAMLLYREVSHLVDLPLFVRLLKHLKGATEG